VLSSVPLRRLRAVCWSVSVWLEARIASVMSAQRPKVLVSPSDFSSPSPSSASSAIRRKRRLVRTQCSTATCRDGPTAPSRAPVKRSFQGPSSTKRYTWPSRTPTCSARGRRLVVWPLAPTTSAPEPL
ncbi:unnamed protein product, partial [Ectocarpus sp. 12 AP-2014]